MKGTKITHLKDAMMSILPQLYPDDVFNIVQYHGEVHLWELNLRSHNVIPKYVTYGAVAGLLQVHPNQMSEAPNT